MRERPGLTKAEPTELYSFDWRTDQECQEYARDHLLAARVRGWCNALAAETAHIGWMLRALPQDDPKVVELTRRWAGARA
jgi:hypothetical protein